MEVTSPVERMGSTTWKILIIDDDEDDFIIVRDMLKEAKGRKFDIQWAPTYEVGREALQSNQFNAVLVDYNLGQHTGIHLIRELNERGYASPLILFTGRGSYEVDVEAMEAGATLYLTKSEANPPMLERSIRYAMEQKQKEQSLREREAQLRKNSAALRVSEERFHKAFNASPNAQVISRREDGTIEIVNDRFEQLFGYRQEEVIGKTSLELNMFADPADREEAVRRIQADGSLRDFELAIRTKSGEVRLASLSIEMISVGSEHLMLTIINDITERERAEAALRENEARFRALISASTQVLYRMSPDWSEMRQLHGGNFLAHTENPNANWMPEYIHPDDQQWVQAVIDNAVRSGTVFELEHRVLRADGTIGWTASRAVPIRNAKGEIVEWFGAASDITERKLAEQAIQENEALFDAFFANSPGILNIVDTEFRYLNSDPITPTYFGLDRQSLIGKSVGELAPEFVESFGAMMRRVIETGQPEQKLQVQSPVSGRSDAMTYWLASYFQVPLPGGKKGLGVMGVDVTEQKIGELALQESEQRYSALFNAKTNAIAHCRLITDEQGNPIDYEYLQVNDAYEAVTGRKPSEIVGRRAREVYPGIENYAYDYIGIYGWVALQGGELQYETFGEAIGKWLSVYVYSPRQGEFTIIFTDIDQRKQAEAALEKTYNDLIHEQNRLLAMMEALPIGIALLDRQGGVIQTNKDYEAIWGRPLPPAHSVDDYEAFQPRWVETGQRVLPEEWAGTLAAQKGEPVTSQFLSVQRFDGTRAFVLNSAAPTRNASGEITGSAVAMMDITKMTEAENALREIQDRFRVAVRAAPLMVYTCDRDLRYLWVYNPTRGFRVEDLLGKRDDEVLPPEAAAELMAAKRMALETGRGGTQEVKVPLHGENTYYLLTTDPIRDQQGKVTGLTCSAIDISDQKRLQMEQQEQAIQIEVQRRLMDRRERERSVIARDLHDGPIQTLSSTLFHLQMIKNVFPDPVLQKLLNEMDANIKITIGELRGVMYDLRPPALITFGLPKVLQQSIEDLRLRFPDLEMELDTVEDDKILSALTHLTLFRIFQAGINNIIRHSGASKIRVVYRLEPDRFYLELRDNGVGFALNKDFSQFTREDHFGLVGMRERAEAIGAEFSVFSEPGKGTTVVVQGSYNAKNLKEQQR